MPGKRRAVRFCIRADSPYSGSFPAAPIERVGSTLLWSGTQTLRTQGMMSKNVFMPDHSSQKHRLADEVLSIAIRWQLRWRQPTEFLNSNQRQAIPEQPAISDVVTCLQTLLLTNN